MSGAGEPCRVLQWDTEFFGRRIAAVNGDQLTPSLIEKIKSFCAEERIECLYFRASANDAQTVELAEQNSFHLVDVRMTWERKLSDGDMSWCRLATPDHLAALRRLARVSHTDSRFYYDGRFPRERCDALFEAWITNAVNGQAALVAWSNDFLAGYVTCDRLSADEGSIGLIARDPVYRGKGIGELLVLAAMEFLCRQGMSTVSVVTQARNVAAQRLYARCGFVPRAVQLYYHRWFS